MKAIDRYNDYTHFGKQKGEYVSTAVNPITHCASCSTELKAHSVISVIASRFIDDPNTWYCNKCFKLLYDAKRQEMKK